MNEIIVSVVLVTYQHERYISKAIESVLMQKVKFQYELIISDDCSKDDTPEILCKYKKQYPNIIKLLLRKKNVGPTRNCFHAFEHTKGKYVIILEGDDYWTDNLKLQKQVDFLEENPHYIGMFHKCRFIDRDDNTFKQNYYANYSNRQEFLMKDYENGKLPGHTTTCLFKNIFLNNAGKYKFLYQLNFYVGDQTIYAILLTMGNFYLSKEEMSVYRIVREKDGTSCASRSANNNLSYEMWKYYNGLEKQINKLTNKKINLKVYKKMQYNKSKKFMKASLSLKNVYLFCKVASSYWWKQFKELLLKEKHCVWNTWR